ncbi:GNAT superfamily N-acetyltransferase [Elusimicrobium posterum]|uniref:GNAT family N-acetyltransferase n=1 Tax=Elusimicrobium posterum TaxID=3116653 RepID=UPI003C7241C5
MTIKPLCAVTQEQLISAFNEAFSDYILPLKLTSELWEARAKRDRIDLSVSYGYFDNDILAGFIFQGAAPGKWYNAGTGVIPAHRGRNITKQIYSHILAKAPEHQIKELSLEVITTNAPAIKIYKDTGLNILRELVCFKGTVSLQNTSSVTVKESTDYNWDILKTFWEYPPTWQLNQDAVNATKDSCVFAQAFENGVLCGYIIYNHFTKLVMQFGAKKENRAEILTALFKYIQDKYPAEITINNVDSRAEQDLAFFKNSGFKETIRQYAMAKNL